MNYISYKNLLSALADTSNDIGVDKNTKINGKDLIVSLTTFGTRINEVALAIESIMRGTVKPTRIILWLDEKRKNETLPSNLRNQMKRGLEIRFIKDIGVNTKIYYPLTEFKSQYVSIADDDHFYVANHLQKMIEKTTQTGNISAWCATHEARRTYHFDCVNKYPNQHFIEHGWGVLYPPDIFDDETFNLEHMLNLSPNNDDVWMHVQEIRQNLKTEQICTPNERSKITIYNKELEFGGSALHDNMNKNPFNGWTKPYIQTMKFYGLM